MQENKQDKYEFISEKIKEKPVNKKETGISRMLCRTSGSFIWNCGKRYVRALSAENG